MTTKATTNFNAEHGSPFISSYSRNHNTNQSRTPGDYMMVVKRLQRSAADLVTIHFRYCSPLFRSPLLRSIIVKPLVYVFVRNHLICVSIRGVDLQKRIGFHAWRLPSRDFPPSLDWLFCMLHQETMLIVVDRRYVSQFAWRIRISMRWIMPIYEPPVG